MHSDIQAYNRQRTPMDKLICDRLADTIDAALTGAESKVWHGHPVWFLEGNPIVGYSKQKAGWRLMFWSGASFEETGLNVLGKRFKDASIFYNRVEEINLKDLKRWLKKSQEIQWDYKNIIKRKGRLELKTSGSSSIETMPKRVAQRTAATGMVNRPTESDQKPAKQKPSSKKLASKKLASKKLASEKLASKKLASEKLASKKLASKKAARQKANGSKRIAAPISSVTSAKVGIKKSAGKTTVSKDAIPKPMNKNAGSKPATKKPGLKSPPDHDQRIAQMTIAAIYPMYLAKVEKKGRTREELDQVIRWLTGFDSRRLQKQIQDKATFETFFQQAKLNPHASLITGLICGYRIEEIKNPLTRQVRCLDKLVDELANGRALEKILRKP